MCDLNHNSRSTDIYVYVNIGVRFFLDELELVAEFLQMFQETSIVDLPTFIL